MSSSPIDYQKVLVDAISPKKVYKLSEVKDKLIKIAFDVVRFKDENPLKLWKIEADGDGDYIVALYNEEELLEKSASVKLNWATKLANKSLLVFYKGMPVIKLASEDLGIPEEELGLVQEYLPESLSTNASLRASLIDKLPKNVKDNLLTQFPELK